MVADAPTSDDAAVVAEREFRRGDRVRRREFIMFLGGAAAWSRGAFAQQSNPVRQIGALFAVPRSDPQAESWVAVLVQELQHLGWVDGRNVRIEYRWADGDVDRIPALAKELVDLQPDVILASTTPVVAALIRESRTIPIIFVAVSDPVGSGFVVSLAHPGSNSTGFNVVEASLGGKWVELLKEMAPQVTRVAFLFDLEMAPYAEKYYSPSLKTAAPVFTVEPIPAPFHNVAEIERAAASIAHERGGGLIVNPDASTFVFKSQIIATAAHYQLPAIYPFRFMAAQGGLVSYGIDLNDLYRRSAAYLDRVLKGAKPAELPVQQPTKFELAINLKTAKALGLTITPSLLARADEVIE
jgi:putative ABC transport system substrate-binding protein